MADQGKNGKSDSYFEIVYEQPFNGLHTTLPANAIERNNSPTFSNFTLRNGELRTRPRMLTLYPFPQAYGIPLGVATFVDAQNNIHTVVVSQYGIYQLTSGLLRNTPNAWQRVYAFTEAPNITAPISFKVSLNKLYITFASNRLYQWDGLVTPTVVSQVDNTPTYAGSYFLGELAFRLIMLNTVEGKTPQSITSFPSRIRWSASGNPTHWNPSSDIGAGFDDMIDVPDSITGFAAPGQNGLVFRSNGISEMIPLAGGTIPFEWNHMWASENGIGNVYPFSIANYGPLSAFLSIDNAYSISMGGLKDIGGKVIDTLYKDIENAAGAPVATILSAFSQSYPYTCWFISIPLQGQAVNYSKNWLYNFHNDSWETWVENSGIITGKPAFVPTA